MGLIQRVEFLKKKNFSASKGLLNRCLATQKPEPDRSQVANPATEKATIPHPDILSDAARPRVIHEQVNSLSL